MGHKAGRRKRQVSLWHEETGDALRDREGYEAIWQKLLRSRPPEEVLRHFKPEQRLAGLAPEAVLRALPLAGLAPEEMLLALPDEALRALSKDYVRTLPRRVQTAIKKRLGK